MPLDNSRVLSRGVRRRWMAGIATAALAASMVTVFPATSAAASLVSDGKISFIPADDGGENSREWVGSNTGTVAHLVVVPVEPGWSDIRYTVVGASGARAGSGQQVLGGLGAMVMGTVPDDAASLQLSWGVRGGAGAGDRASGDSASPIGEEAGMGGSDWGAAYYPGGGGGGASFLGWRASPATNWGFLVVAGGGGGAAGGTEHALCPGAQGGHAGQAGFPGPQAVTGAPGSQVMLCQHADGGQPGSAFTSPETGRSDGQSATRSPGSGGGGGGYFAGAGGVAVAAEEGIFAPAGGAGGGGGGGSYIHGDSSATVMVAPADWRGDGRVILEFYEAHELELYAGIDLGQAHRAGYTHRVDFSLDAPVNAPEDELNRDGVVTATLNGTALVSALSGARVTGTIASGMEVVLPASGAGTHELCFEYVPASDKLSPASKCIELAIGETELSTSLETPAQFFRDPVDDECQVTCTLVPAMTQGPWLYPGVKLVNGIELGGRAPLESTDIALHWTDITSGTSGIQLIEDAERAREPGPVIGVPDLLPPFDGSWRYEYVDFQPSSAAPEVGHVYRIEAVWADAGLFQFTPSDPLTVKIVPSASTLEAGVDDSSVSIGEHVWLEANATGTPGPHLPFCCGNWPWYESTGPVSGTFAAELTRNDDAGTVIDRQERTGTSASWNSWPRLGAGEHTLRVTFSSADPAWGDSVRTVGFTVNRISTETAVDVNPGSAPYGMPREVTASVTAPDSAIEEAPTGTVAFVLERPGDDLDLGTAAVGEDGTAVVSLDASIAAEVMPGTDSVVATYSGDALHLGSTTELDITTLPQPPAITSDDHTTFTAGDYGSFAVTATGVPHAELTVAGALPSGVNFIDNGDGTGELAGTTDDYGTFTVYLVASNDPDASTNAIQTFYLTVAVPEVALPETGPPLGSGTLTGVPAETEQGESIEVTATGFAPRAPVSFGIYSDPRVLSSAVADVLGEVTATLTIPHDLLGEHTVVAAGMSPALSPQFLTAETQIVKPAAALAATGAAIGPLVSILTGLLVVGVLAVLVSRRREDSEPA